MSNIKDKPEKKGLSMAERAMQEHKFMREHHLSYFPNKTKPKVNKYGYCIIIEKEIWKVTYPETGEEIILGKFQSIHKENGITVFENEDGKRFYLGKTVEYLED